MVSALVIAVTLGAGLAQRKSLLRNTFHRRMWILILVTLLQNMALRLIGGSLGLTFQQVGPVELVVLAGTATLGGAYFFRSMFGLAALLGIASAAWVLLGQPAAPFVSPAYSIALGWMLWEWTTGGTPIRRTASLPGGSRGETGEPSALSNSDEQNLRGNAKPGVAV